MKEDALATDVNSGSLGEIFLFLLMNQYIQSRAAGPLAALRLNLIP